MSTVLGMPYIFEDTTGNVFDSNFTEFHQRMSFSVRCTMRTTERTVVMIYNASGPSGRSGLMVPFACLDFGANNALGTVKIGEREPVEMEMEKYLVKVSRK